MCVAEFRSIDFSLGCVIRNVCPYGKRKITTGSHVRYIFEWIPVLTCISYLQYLYIKTVDVKCQQKDLLSSQKLDFLNIWFDPLQPLNNSFICHELQNKTCRLLLHINYTHKSIVFANPLFGVEKRNRGILTFVKNILTSNLRFVFAWSRAIHFVFYK
jgi:hypothetical protein